MLFSSLTSFSRRRRRKIRSDPIEKNLVERKTKRSRPVQIGMPLARTSTSKPRSNEGTRSRASLNFTQQNFIDDDDDDGEELFQFSVNEEKRRVFASKAKKRKGKNRWRRSISSISSREFANLSIESSRRSTRPRRDPCSADDRRNHCRTA